MNDYYNIFPEDPDELRKAFRRALYIMLAYICAMAFVYLTASCTSQKEVARTDTLYVTRNDTVRITDVKTNKVTEYIDRWRDRYIVVNDRGDTIKDRQKEYCYINYSQEQHDSIEYYRSLADSMRQLKNKEKVVYKEKELNWWEKLKVDTYIIVLLAFFATISTVAIYIYYHVKKP